MAGEPAEFSQTILIVPSPPAVLSSYFIVARNLMNDEMNKHKIRLSEYLPVVTRLNFIQSFLIVASTLFQVLSIIILLTIFYTEHKISQRQNLFEL